MNSILIAGAGQAAIETAAALRARGFEGQVCLFGAERKFPYQRPPLSKQILTGKMDLSALDLRAEAFYTNKNIKVRTDTQVTHVDPAARTIQLESGETASYDKLLIATGARPRPLPIEGSHLKGVCYLRSLEDALNIQQQLLPGNRLVIIGGGYIGLEVAASARTMGCEVSVCEMAPMVMSRQVDGEVASLFEERHRAEGVNIRCSARVSAIKGVDSVEAVIVDGESVPADLVIIGVGAIPNTECLANTDLLTDGALWVDANCRSRDPHIYGAGDVTTQLRANGLNMRLESVQNAAHQSKAAAAAMLGQEPPRDEVPWFWSEQYDMKLQIAGLPAEGDEPIVRRFDNGISVVYLNRDIVSAVSVVGNPREFMAAKKLIIKKCPVKRDQIADSGITLKELIQFKTGDEVEAHVDKLRAKLQED